MSDSTWRCREIIISIQLLHCLSQIQLRYRSPIYRDAVAISGGGYMVMRIKTNNPGGFYYLLITCNHQSNLNPENEEEI